MAFSSLILYFVVIYAARQASGCGYTVKANDREQTINSPGFPYNYATYTSCEWTVQAEYGSHVFINITDFDLGTGDYLSLFDGPGRSNLIASYTSLTSLAGRQSTFTTKSNTATLYFTTNYSDAGNKGFSLHFIMDCLDNPKCSEVGATKACADQDVGQTFCPKLCGSCPNILQQLLG